jgi:hypothetical protein
MPSAAEFLTGSPAPKGGAGQSAGAFLTGGSAPPAQEQSYGGQMLDTFTGDIGKAFGQLKDDFLASTGDVTDPAAKEKFMSESFWEQQKDQFKSMVAAGKLPADAFNAILSPIVGAADATVALPVSKGVHALLPGSEEMEKQGKLPKAREGVLESLALAVPAEGGAASIAAKAPRSTFSHILQRPLSSPEVFSKRYLARKLDSEGITLDTAKEKMKKPGSALVDLGSSAMTEAGEQAAMSGEGRRLGVALFREDRMKGRRARTAEAVNNLGNDKNMYEHLDELNEQRRKDAKPLYEEAFAGGSHAALKTQLEDEFAGASKAAHEARQKVSDAENTITLTTAKHRDVGDNVYGNASRNEDMGAAARRKADAEAELEKAETRRQDALDRLRVAQEHEASGKKGAVWSPRVQQFIDHKLFKPGLARGLEIQETEALRDGVPFDPTEYGVTGKDAEGNPIVSKVPNMRMLDAAKRGVDALLREKHQNPVTKAFEPDELGRAQVGANQAFVKELDDLTGGEASPYKKAREAWSGPTQVMDAVHDGMKFEKLAPELIKKKMAGMRPDVADGYRTGVLRKISDDIAGGTRAALRAATSIIDDDYYQRQLKEILGEEKFGHLMEMAQREVDYAQRGGAVISGSQTQRLKEGSKEIDSLGSAMADELVTAAGEGLTGFAASPKRLGMRLASRWMDHILTGMSQARRDALAKLIFSTDHDDKMRALEMIYEEGNVSVPTHGKRVSIPAIAGAAHSVQEPAPQQ